MGIAFACSDKPVALSRGFDVPGTLEVSGIALGRGNVLGGGSSQLGCDDTIAVSLTVADWKLRPPGSCDVSQCGRVHLALSSTSVDYVLTQESANTGVTFSLVPYDVVTGEDDGRKTVVSHPPVSGTYTLTAELVDDLGKPYDPGDGGKVSAEVSFQVDLPTNCDAVDGDAGAGGSRANSDGGAAGLAGSAGATEGAGAAGQSAGGSAGE